MSGRDGEYVVRERSFEPSYFTCFQREHYILRRV